MIARPVLVGEALIDQLPAKIRETHTIVNRYPLNIGVAKPRSSEATDSVIEAGSIVMAALPIYD